MKSQTLLSAVFLCTTLSLSASSVVMEPLVVKSSPLDLSQYSAPESYEIYTSQEIENSNANTLYEFLAQYTSLSVEPSYGNELNQRLDMRGYGSNGYQNIVIIVDGRRLNNIDMSVQLLTSIQPQAVERIEILKGSGSVLGGDGANAGVINIITKKLDSKELTLYGGLYDTYGAQLNLNHTTEFVSTSASMQLHRSGGTRHINSEQDRDKNSLLNGSIDVRLTPTDMFEVRAGVLISRTDSNYGGPMSKEELESNPAQPGSGYGYGASPSEQKYNSDLITLGATYDLNQRVSFNIDLSREDKKSDFVTYNSIYNYRYDTIKTTASYGARSIKLYGGFELFDGTRDSKASLYKNANETTKRAQAIFLLAKTGFGAHTFKVGARSEEVEYSYDDNNRSLTKSETLQAVELGVNYRLSDTKSLFLSYSHAYQAPDVDRFFSGDGKSSKFNNFIDPMSSDNFTVGYNLLESSLKFKAQLYYTLLKNEIYYYSDPSWVASTNTNIDESSKYGADLFVKWQADDALAFLFNYNYVKATIEKERYNGEDFSGNTLPGVSEHSAKMSIELKSTERTTLLLSQSYRSSAYALDDLNNDFKHKQDAYYSADATLSYSAKKARYFITINNIFADTNSVMVKESVYYPTTHATRVKIGVKVKF